MLQRTSLVFAGLVMTAAVVSAADKDGFQKGTPDLKSSGPLAFGPNGILFVGDFQGAAIFALDTGDQSPGGSGPVKVAKIDEQIASVLGTTPREILINDVAVNPKSKAAYLSISRGRGPDAIPVIVRVDSQGKLRVVSLENSRYSKMDVPNANERKRQEAITDLAYINGRVFVAGLSNEQFASTLRSFPFPFAKGDKGTSVEIYHGAHGRFETNSPVRTFTAFDIGDETNILAAYTCTPLVRFPVKNLVPGAHVKGTTIAELGNRNRPLDMITYKQGGKDYILMANSSRGMMKITTDGIAEIEGITTRVPGGGKAGLKYDTIPELKGVQQLDKLDEQNAIVLIRAADGSQNLESVPLP